MAATGNHLVIRRMGENVLGVELEGDPRKPEPIHFRVMLPGGDVDIVRTTDGQNWIHVRVNRAGDGWEPDRVMGRIVAARLDCLDRSTQDVNVGDFGNPTLYHLAVRIARETEAPLPQPTGRRKGKR